MADVGIVMPVYLQNLQHLETAIQSVLNQSYTNFELVIVSDGAPQHIVHKIYQCVGLDHRVEVVEYEQNQGVAHALNVGFDRLMSRPGIDYLTWVSSDNIYYKNFLEVLVDGMKSAPPNVGLVYGSFKHILEDGSPAFDSATSVDFIRDFQTKPKEELLNVCFIGPAFLHRTSVCRQTGQYRLDPIQDYDYWIRMSEHCDIKYIPIELMSYRLNSPYALSTAIKESRKEHRKCWDAVHLSVYEARKRRGIAPEVTVVYLMRHISHADIERLNQLVDQYYNNYRLKIIDLSNSKSSKQIAHHIKDPRIRIRRKPGGTIKQAIYTAVKNIKTPYTFLCNKTTDLSNTYILMSLIREHYAHHHIISSFSKSGSVAHHSHFNRRLTFGSLYKTDKLQAFLKKHKMEIIRHSSSRRTSQKYIKFRNVD